MTGELTADEHHHQWLSHSSARADLSPLDPLSWEVLLAEGRERRVESGTLLAASGRPVDPVFVVSSGDVHLAARSGSGRRHVVGVARTGSVVGDIPLLCEHPWPFDVLAARETTVLELPAEGLIELLRGRGDMAVQWAMSIAKRLESSHRRRVAMLTKDLPARVATCLLEERVPNAQGELEVTIAQEVIGQLIGARRQSVARVLADFRVDELIASRYGATAILDADRLAEVAGEPLHQVPCTRRPFPAPAEQGSAEPSPG